jgi:hypothetical protein
MTFFIDARMAGPPYPTVPMYKAALSISIHVGVFIIILSTLKQIARSSGPISPLLDKLEPRLIRQGFKEDQHHEKAGKAEADERDGASADAPRSQAHVGHRLHGRHRRDQAWGTRLGPLYFIDLEIFVF